MFRTGHRSDHAAEPAPEPAPKPEANVEPKREAESKRETVPAGRPEPAAAAVRPGRADANLGRGVSFDGTLRFTGGMTIEGTFSGKILSGDVLTIGEGANVNAEVSCDSISVHGTASGSLTAKTSVELHAPAQVNAAVVAPSLVIDRGVSFDGSVQMRVTRRRNDGQPLTAPAVKPRTM